MSKNLLFPSCLAAMVLTGSLAGFCAFQYSNGVNADRFYSAQTNTLQNSALNAITLSIKASSDASYIGQLQQAAGQVDSSMETLRRGNSSAGIPPLPNVGIGSLDHFNAAWGKVLAAIEQIANSRGNNAAFERQSGEASQLASSLLTESADAIQLIKASPTVDARLKQLLVKAQENLTGGIEPLASTASPNSDTINLALDASKTYVVALANVGGSMPRDNTLIKPLLKSYNTAQSLTRSAIRAVESSTGTVDNAPYARAIWTERENLEAATNGLQHAVASLPQSRMVSPVMMMGSIGLMLIVVVSGVTLILREARAHTKKAEALANTIQSSQKERSHDLRTLNEEIQSAGNGDLTVEFTENRDSTHEIATALNMVFPQFREVVKDVQQTIVSLSAASEQTLAMAKSTERSRSEQVQAIQHIAKLVTELNDFTKQLDGVFSRTRDSSLTVGTQIKTGSNAVQEVHEGVVKLSQSNMNIMHQAKTMTENIQSLEQMVDVVRRVANQSATVAFNAFLAADTITEPEVAKRVKLSGEAMKGLTDSATEAADLIATNLQSINTAAKDTQYVLEESQSDIKILTTMSANAIKAMQTINEHVAQVVDGIISVAGQTKDLNTRSDEVADTMEKIHHYSSDHSSASEQTATAISNLNSEAQRVGITLAQFKV
uniref:Methyl-accepting chemotaxis protein n=1 Tax=Pseudomonas fluorescens (strain SBW25) TaxID=216595 RepID=A0A0G4E427_PSEFS|nr:methyl-accepting chemotaxis protein [Pseudomonas fluorescens]CEK42000.1 Methyl-accepting chemotaxis protein [Pseudomonas fluorescens SBW25]